MNIHGVKTEKREVFFYSFKGGTESTLDQIDLPPSDDMLRPREIAYTFGEWLRRNGHNWRFLSEETLCRLAVDFFNHGLLEGESPRTFDRMAEPNPQGPPP